MNCLSKSNSSKITVNRNDIEVFNKLLEDPVLKEFLEFDKCYIYADNYLIAMVFTYFKRAQFTYKQYTRYNFFVALYLAHDMEEDNEDLKYDLYIWALGENWIKYYKNLLKSREALWQKIDHRGVVSRKCCERVISIVPSLSVWRRFRSESHGGAPLYESGSDDCIYTSPDICCERLQYALTEDDTEYESDEMINELMTSDESF